MPGLVPQGAPSPRPAALREGTAGLCLCPLSLSLVPAVSLSPPLLLGAKVNTVFGEVVIHRALLTDTLSSFPSPPPAHGRP